jgi:UDP:flavonoid glycosyltransferase YjiC (YdhE family)
MSKYLVAPLNWGLGHASRCVPLIQRFLDEGHEVILGGDGDSLTLLRKHFPKLRYVYLAPLNLRYSKGSRQVFAILRAIPRLIAWSIKDHAILKAVLREEHIDMIVSDNRFGLYINRKSSIVQSSIEAVYITHQLHIMLPKGWRWAEGIAERLHRCIYRRFDEVWVPDFEDPANSLAGEMSHPKSSNFQTLKPSNLRYIGPLSRFEISKSRALEISNHYDTVAVLSGLEPHRTMLEQEIVQRFSGKQDKVLIIQGLMGRPNTTIKRGNITIVPYLSDEDLAAALLGAKHIIARSGYSTIMDLHALGLLSVSPKDGLSAERSVSITVCQCNGPLVELLPTPGQPEQEYLAQKIENNIKKGNL